MMFGARRCWLSVAIIVSDKERSRATWPIRTLRSPSLDATTPCTLAKCSGRFLTGNDAGGAILHSLDFCIAA